MFRGGDYYDNPKFENVNRPARNNLDVSDIAGAKAKSNHYDIQGKDHIDVSDINGKQNHYMYKYGPTQGELVPGQPMKMGAGVDYSEFNRQAMQCNQNKAAGVAHRPKTGERIIKEVWQKTDQAPYRITNRSLQTNDILGAQPKYSATTQGTLNNAERLARQRGGAYVSPQKNQSSVFSHLTGSFGRETLKKKDIAISKPKFEQDFLAARETSLNSGNPYTSLQQQSYDQHYQALIPSQQQPLHEIQPGNGIEFNDASQRYKMQGYQQPEVQALEWGTGVDGQQINMERMSQRGNPDVVGYSQNGPSMQMQNRQYYDDADEMNNQISRDFEEQQRKQDAMFRDQQPRVVPMNLLPSNNQPTDTYDRHKSNALLQSGSQIFNSGGYSKAAMNSQNSRRSVNRGQEKFEQNYQKPMAERNSSIDRGEIMRSIAQQRPAGSSYDINIAKRATMEEGKDRLFGVGNQNSMQPKQDSFRTGKRVNQPPLVQKDFFNEMRGGYNFNNFKDVNIKPHFQRGATIPHVPLPGYSYGQDLPVPSRQIDMQGEPYPMGMGH